MTTQQEELTWSLEARMHDVRAALLRVPAGLTPLLEAAIGPITSGASAAWGLLIALNEGAIESAAVCEGEIAETTEVERVEPLWTQGIAGYAAARGLPVVLRDIGADPRWGPPSLDESFPQVGAALAVPLGEPADVVLVLVAPNAEAFTAEHVAWVREALEWLRQPLSTARTLQHALESLSQLEKRDSLRRELSAMALHDMRNTLQNISMSLRAIERLTTVIVGAEKAAPVVEVTRLGEQSTAQLAGLARNLLDVARLEDDHVMVAAQETSVEPAIASALAVTGPLLEASGCTVETCVAPYLPAVPHDPRLIERVIANLIDHAIKHSPAAGRIRVSATPFAQGVCVRVADNRPEIPPDLLDGIFNKYFKVQPESDEKLDGVGLGLAFCRLTVAAHGGEIWAENGAEAGVVFAFTLPGSREQAQVRHA
jgi:K+-sensing histidine kinase KdpD